MHQKNHPLSHEKKRPALQGLTTRLLFRLLPVQILLAAVTGINSIVSGLFASNFIGAEAMSAVGFYAPIQMLFVAISAMLVSGAVILCGKHIGQNRDADTQNTFFLGVLIAAIVGAVFTVILLLLGKLDGTAFLAKDPAVRPLFNRYLMGQASDKHVLVHLLAALDGVICVACYGALFIRRLGIDSIHLANIGNGITTTLVIIAYAWIRKKRFPRNMEELMVIPDDFGVPKEARTDLAVGSLEEAVTASEDARVFCGAQGIEKKRAHLAALAIEELAGNTVKRGFPRDRGRHHIDVCVAHKGTDLILRIRDDCQPFDPREGTEAAGAKELPDNIGLHTVFTMAKDAQYQNVLGLNVLTLRI